MGSNSTEFYLGPDLQYVVDPRFVVEGILLPEEFEEKVGALLRPDVEE